MYSGAYYDPAHDADNVIALDRWGHGFDALFHLRTAGAADLP